MLSRRKATLLISVSFFLLVIDRVLKSLVNRISDVEVLIPNVLHFRLFENDRIAFSLPIEWGMWLNAVALIVIAFVVVKAYTSLKQSYFYESALWGTVFLGASSNMYDRLTLGFVIDYAHIPPSSFFNIADLLIAAGVILLFFIKPKICRI